MNKERLELLAQTVERQPHTTEDDDAGFQMDVWNHECGTPACIAGFGAMLMYGLKATDEIDFNQDHVACWLGINKEDAETLFLAHGRHKSLSKITPAEAGRVIRHLIATGEVDWSIIAE